MVTIDISGNFLFPIVSVGLRLPSPPIAVMPVPEATMDEYNLSPAWEHQVWFARQILAVEAESEAELVNESPYDHLRPRVLRLNRAHGRATRRVSRCCFLHPFQSQQKPVRPALGSAAPPATAGVSPA